MPDASNETLPEPAASTVGEAGSPAAQAASPAMADQAANPADQPAQQTDTYSFAPPDTTSWVRPGLAVIVVCFVALLIAGILLAAVFQLHVTMVPSANGTPGAALADPNAGTIAALAGAALSSITSLAAAYFGIKVASEQTTQASAQASAATTHALTVLGNSTKNRNSQ